MVSRRSNEIADPVLPDQGGRETQADPGQPAVEETVRRRAYDLFQRRGMKHGYDQQDWFAAEAQVRAEPRNSQLAPDIDVPKTLVAD